MIKNVFCIFLVVFFTKCTFQKKSFVGKKSENTLFSSIGTKNYVWVDTNRFDSYYGGERIVNAQVWYPSVNSRNEANTSVYYYRINEVYHSLNWSQEDFNLVTSIQTKSLPNALLDSTKRTWPLIVFSPSLGGNLSNYTFYAENLAEEGYIVMGINHLHESEYVLDKENKIHPVNLVFHDSLKALDIPDDITANNYRLAKGIRHKVLAEDLVFSINQILHEKFFHRRIDTNKIGTFGHSIGGAAAIYSSIIDPRVKAVLNLDGTPPTLGMENGISVPFMFIEDLTDYKNHLGYAKIHRRRSEFCTKNSEDSWRVLFSDINHNSFLDGNYHFADNKIEQINSLEVLNKTQNYMKTFFNATLTGKPMKLNEVNSDTIEILYFKGAL